MMKRIVALSIVALVTAGVGVAGEMAWFDMENCAMCKNISSHPDMMKSMKWEQYNISDGMVSMTIVQEKYMDDYRKAHEDMSKTGAELMSGKMLPMCGSCTALGMCMMKGVSQEYVETSSGDIWIVTSDDPEVVKDLHNWVNRNQEEMAKSKQSMEG